MKKIHKNLLALFIITMVSSCDEKDFLKEVPLDFYSPENSYVTYSDFEAAVINLHNVYRNRFIANDEPYRFPLFSWCTTELTYQHPDVTWNFESLFLSTSDFCLIALWEPAYKIIYDANAIIERADSDINKMNDDEKNKIKSEAMFFRSLMYKMLANMYGGVPLYLEETKEPKRNFIRSSRKDVYNQCITDLEFAVQYLPDIDAVDISRINRLTAYHVLAELYVTLERWQDAIIASSTVIDSPKTGLMMERFGTMVDNPYGLGGDVYWDLFRVGNQGRDVGNTETLWVIPFKYNVPGGGRGDFSPGFITRLWQFKIYNENGTTVPLVPCPNDFYYGRGIGMGKPSQYFCTTLWEKSGYDVDIRNSKYNIQRDFQVANPASDHYGKWVVKDNLKYPLTDTLRNFYPAVAKLSTIGQFPRELYLPDQTVPGSLYTTDDTRRAWRARYIYRLAETYLLRAEAYLGKGDKNMAAADINIVRRRANAPNVEASDVDLDYILDERLRELHYEEFYVCTENRLGKTVERASRLNVYPGGPVMYKLHNNLWPIPYSEIEKNTGAVLEQNPGY
jgi:hypothetical protein